MFFLISNSSIYHFRMVVDRLIIGKQALIIHVLWWSELGLKTVGNGNYSVISFLVVFL